MAKLPETIAQKLTTVWPGFSVHPDQTVGELRQWIAGELRQLTDALVILLDPAIVGANDSARLTDPVSAGKHS